MCKNLSESDNRHSKTNHKMLELIIQFTNLSIKELEQILKILSKVLDNKKYVQEKSIQQREAQHFASRDVDMSELGSNDTQESDEQSSEEDKEPATKKRSFEVVAKDTNTKYHVAYSELPKKPEIATQAKKIIAEQTQQDNTTEQNKKKIEHNVYPDETGDTGTRPMVLRHPQQ